MSGLMDRVWTYLAAGSTGVLSIGQAGTLRTDWLKLAVGSRNEDMIIRVICKGGDKPQNVVFYGVSMQLR